MILAPSKYMKGLEAYEPGDEFLSRLQAYDECLEAYKNFQDQEIVVYSNRHGAKTLEFKAKRAEGMNWPELENRIIHDLPKMDVWKRFGSQQAFEEAFENQIKKDDKEKLKRNKENRKDRLKEDVDKAKFDLGFRVKKVNVGYQK